MDAASLHYTSDAPQVKAQMFGNLADSDGPGKGGGGLRGGAELWRDSQEIARESIIILKRFTAKRGIGPPRLNIPLVTVYRSSGEDAFINHRTYAKRTDWCHPERERRICVWTMAYTSVHADPS
ncbi:MAG: hypothetical protein KY468_01655, partial [Armatimonadetes bacterium]|nr:hypothetical protein [Armatimonadota bacterium]